MLAGLTSLVAFTIFCGVWTARGEKLADRFRLPWTAILLCVLGIGGYRAVYLTALGMVPVIEASLLNYLYPIFLILFTCFLPGERLRWNHVAGVLCGFAGVFILLHKPGVPFGEPAAGHLLALAAAVMWGGYSVITRVFKKHSSDAVPVSFLFSGIVLLLLSLLFDQPWVVKGTELFFMVVLAATMGGGYFFWNIAMKHGHIQMIGVLAYFSPLISTVLLFIFGKAVPAPGILLAVVLIVAGPFIASFGKVIGALAELKKLKA